MRIQISFKTSQLLFMIQSIFGLSMTDSPNEQGKKTKQQKLKITMKENTS